MPWSACSGSRPSRRVWLKDYGWTPSGSFKLLGALNWMANNLERIGTRPVAAHSSGNFASGIAYAGMRFGRRVIVVMPETAPRVKFELTRSFGAEIRTYDIARDHQTGERDRLTRADRRGRRRRPGLSVRRSPRDRRQRRRRPGDRPRPAARGTRDLALRLPGQRRRIDGRTGVGSAPSSAGGRSQTYS